MRPTPASLARIDAASCIGCMLCLPVCPTRAIEGEAKQAHRVINAACTGCGLCVAPCPVEAIAMVPTYAAANTLDTALPQALKNKIAAARQKARSKAKAYHG